MGRKIFISYKYWDDDVYPVPRFSDYHPKVRDYVSWLEDKFQNRTEHYYKGESDNEDLSMYSENYIWDKLKDKMYDSSLTIIHSYFAIKSLKASYCTGAFLNRYPPSRTLATTSALSHTASNSLLASTTIKLAGFPASIPYWSDMFIVLAPFTVIRSRQLSISSNDIICAI